ASPDGRWLAIFQPFSPRLRVYHLPDFEEVAALTHRAAIFRAGFSPSGDELAVASLKGVEVWKVGTWQHKRDLTNAVAMLYAPDGQSWWLTHDYRAAGLYDAHSLRLLLPLPADTLPLALSHDGR